MPRGKKISLPPAPGVQVFVPPTAKLVEASSPAGAPKTALQALPLTKQIVVSAYTNPHDPAFLIKKRAYRAAHPNTTDGTAEVEGHRVLSDPRVRLAIDEELKGRGWDRERVLGVLEESLELARAQHKASDLREGGMAIAKIQQLIIDKSEVKSVSDQELDVMRRIVNETLTQGGSVS